MSGKLFKNGVQSDGDISTTSAKNLKLGRADETAGGGGSVYARHVYLGGSVGGLHIYDGTTEVLNLRHDGQPATQLEFIVNSVTTMAIDMAGGFTTMYYGLVIEAPLSSSANALSFNDGTVDVGMRAYAIKGSTQYDLYIDGVLACTTSAVRMSFAAGKYIVVSNVGQASEYNIGTVTTTAAVDWAANGASQRLTLTNGTACTVSMTPPATVGWLTLKTISPASGTVPAITYPVAVKWAGGTKPVQAATLGRANIQRLYWDGTNYWGDAIVNAA